jgi:hypothetical protein
MTAAKRASETCRRRGTRRRKKRRQQASNASVQSLPTAHRRTSPSVPVTTSHVRPSSKRSFLFTFRHQNSVCIFVIPHSCHMVRPSHPPSFDHPNTAWWRATAINIITIIIIIIYTSWTAWTLKMEAMQSVETSETINEIIKGNTLEVSRIHENLLTLTPYFGFHEKRGNLLTSWHTVSFLRTVLRGIR